MNRKERRLHLAQQRTHVRAHPPAPLDSSVEVLADFAQDPTLGVETLLSNVAATAVMMGRGASSTERKSADILAEQLEILVNDDIRRVVVATGWHGVTLETIDEELALAAIDIATRKTDLIFVMHTIDVLARNSLKAARKSQLRGQDLIASMEQSDFPSSGRPLTFKETEAISKMRETALALGWRDAIPETFDTLLKCAVAERTAAIVDKTRIDDMLGDELMKFKPYEQAAVESRFKVRLGVEYKRLRPQEEKASAASMIDAVQNSAARMSNLEEALLDEAPSSYWKEVAEEGDAFKRDLDSLLMHWGRAIWTKVKDAPDYDEAVREIVGEILAAKVDRYFPAEALMFSSIWAVDAFQRITTTHTFAAALMCSDPDRASLEALERQWRAVMIMLPNGIFELHDSKGAVAFELTRILVSVDDASAKMIFIYPITAHGVTVWAYGRIAAPTLADLLLDPPNDSYKMSGSNGEQLNVEHLTEEYRVAVLAQRLVAGLFLAMQAQENFTERVTPEKPPSKSKRTPGAPEHRFVHVGRPLTIDLRDQVRDYIAHGPKRKGHGPPTVQTLVRGHFRRQVCGVGRTDRKVIWIEPFWRGPEEAIISVRPKKLE